MSAPARNFESYEYADELGYSTDWVSVLDEFPYTNMVDGELNCPPYLKSINHAMEIGNIQIPREVILIYCEPNIFSMAI